MVYLVLFADGRVKAYPDQDSADHCNKVDGGVAVVAVQIAQPAAPALAPAP
jgi:hypothetical protein